MSRHIKPGMQFLTIFGAAALTATGALSKTPKPEPDATSEPTPNNNVQDPSNRYTTAIAFLLSR